MYPGDEPEDPGSPNGFRRRWRRFLHGPLTATGAIVLVALLLALGWLAEMADFYLQTLYEDHGPWPARGLLLGVVCLLLLWRFAASRWPR